MQLSEVRGNLIWYEATFAPSLATPSKEEGVYIIMPLQLNLCFAIQFLYSFNKLSQIEVFQGILE